MACSTCERVRGMLPDALAKRLRDLEAIRETERGKRATKGPFGETKRPDPATSGVSELAPAGRAQPVTSRGGRP